MSVRNDRGQASLVLVLAVPALLAAAEQWRSYVADAIQAADGRHPEDALDRLRALLTTDPTALGGSLVSHRARELAAANNSEVSAPTVRRAGAGIEFAVSTRNFDTVNSTSTRPVAAATAVVELQRGACWRGSRLGLRYHGDCLGWSDLVAELTPEPPEDPDEDEDEDEETAEPEPPPEPDPVRLELLRADTRLVA